MIVHPSLMLIASLDEREHNDDVAADVKRAFVHLAPTTVRSHPAADPACNVLQLKVNFAKKYWLSADEGADETWPHVREWLAGKRYFVGENIKSFNESRSKRSEQTVSYHEIDLLMAKNTVRIAVEPAAALPAFEDIAEQLRTLVNEGALGQGAAVEVVVPSSKSLAAQRAAWEAAQAEKAAAQAAQAESQEGADQAEAAVRGEVAEAPAGAEAPADVAEAEAQAPEAQAAEAPEAEPMPIDYSVWGVMVEGAEREFDPAKGAWL